MKSHVWRPLWVVLGIIAIILAIRFVYVPSDFGVGERGFMYSYHRAGNQQEWENDISVKFRTREYCKDCHPDKIEANQSGKHRIIQCENCHGVAGEHPIDPQKLQIDRSRKLCMRCHVKLPYPTSDRAKIPGIDPQTHNPDIECANCHNPHLPDLEAWK